MTRPNKDFKVTRHRIRTRGDGQEYVRIRDVDGNWIEVDVTPENEEEFRNPNYIFKKARMRDPRERRQRKHPQLSLKN